MGRSNTAATLATSAAAIAPASHPRPRVPNVIAAGCHTRTGVPVGGRPAAAGVDQVRLNSSLGKWLSASPAPDASKATSYRLSASSTCSWLRFLIIENFPFSLNPTTATTIAPQEPPSVNTTLAYLSPVIPPEDN